MDEQASPDRKILALSSKLLKSVSDVEQKNTVSEKESYERATMLLDDMAKLVDRIDFGSLQLQAQRSLKKMGILLFNSKMKNNTYKSFVRHGGCLLL